MAYPKKFVGKLAFLSNMYQLPIPIEVRTNDGHSYSVTNVESGYQLLKSDTHVIRQQFEGVSGLTAKKLGGRRNGIITDFDAVKFDRNQVSYMQQLITAKFSIPELRDKLISVPDADLVEYNCWNDDFWGVCTDKGRNMLGKLLKREKYSILYSTNNIFETNADILVCTVNCRGTMGEKGSKPHLAKQFADKFGSGLVAAYKQAPWTPGAVCIATEYGVALVATKDDWRENSELSWVTKGMINLRRQLKDRGDPTVSIPRIGCGQGGLSWGIVKPIVLAVMQGYNNIFWVDGEWYVVK